MGKGKEGDGKGEGKGKGGKGRAGRQGERRERRGSEGGKEGERRILPCPLCPSLCPHTAPSRKKLAPPMFLPLLVAVSTTPTKFVDLSL